MEALNAWNQERNLISRLFTFETTQSSALVPAQPGAGDDFEPESEFGIPQASRRDIDYLRMGFPLEFFDARSAFTHKYLRDAPYDQLVLQHNDKIEQDSRLLFRNTRTFIRQVMGAVAQLDRSMLTARMMAGRRRKKADGGHPSGSYPFGFTKTGPDPDEQATLARITSPSTATA